MVVNKFGGTCDTCGSPVPALGGTIERHGRRWKVYHLACKSGSPSVIAIQFNSDEVHTRNVNGRCEDAPCCGCCTI